MFTSRWYEPDELAQRGTLAVVRKSRTDQRVRAAAIAKPPALWDNRDIAALVGIVANAHFENTSLRLQAGERAVRDPAIGMHGDLERSLERLGPLRCLRP